MIWWLYNLLFPVAYACLLPHFFLRMWRRGGYRRDFCQRFASYRREVAALLDAPGRPVWIQAVSVGELAVAFSLMDELRRIDPSVRFVLTCNTSTGHALALKRLAPPDVTLYFPMDTPGVMRRALRRIRPSAIVLVENEIWPNWIRSAAKMGIPAVMVNGRISAHSHKGYRKLRPFTRDLLPRIRWFCMQTEGDRDRLLDLGAPADRMEITGSAKYDISPTPPEARDRARAVLDRAGIAPSRRILVGGSTWDGEEAALLDFYARNRAAHPDWFPESETAAKVLNEQSLFDTDGEEYRPDRVILQGSRAVIVDYKFGQEKEGYRYQLQRYARLWHELGYDVVGAYVWYVENDKTVKAI